MEADLKRARTSQKNLEKDLEGARRAETELRTQTVELESKLQYQKRDGYGIEGGPESPGER